MDTVVTLTGHTVTPLERIIQLRRCIHVHSVIYYHLDEAYIPDHIFDEWSNRLVRWNREFPELLRQGHAWELFEDWTGDTGMHLPATPRVLNLAHQLIESNARNPYVG